MVDNMWGAQLFLHNIVRRLRTRKVGDSTDFRATLSARALNSGYFPNTWNILLLGTPGSGKSSLIYTLWRSLTDTVKMETEKEATEQSPPAVTHLSLDWNFLDFDSGSKFELDMESFEDPTVLMRAEDKSRTEQTVYVTIQGESEECSGITIIDTPGISDMNPDETTLVQGCVSGSEGEGAGIGSHAAAGYWVSRRAYGLTPHVVAIVVDMSLPSFQDLLDVDVHSDTDWAEKAPQLRTYHAMIDAAIERGLEVFVILTHLDSYHKHFENIIVRKDSDPEECSRSRKASNDFEHLTTLKDIQDTEDADGDGRLGEDMLGELKGIYLQLSQSLSFGGRDVPPDRMFVIENYRNAKRRPEHRLALAAAEGLEAVLDAADVYIQRQYEASGGSCALS